MSMSWRDRLILKMMGSRFVIKVFSNTIVLKVMMGMTQVIISLMSRFKRKKEPAG